MIRVAKITDYAMVILSFIAKISASNPSITINTGTSHNNNISPIPTSNQNIFCAKTIANQTSIPLPTVAKILKILAQKQLLTSYRGTSGGYQLAINPDNISVFKIIEIFEGPLAIMECNINKKQCSIAKKCHINNHFTKINQMIYQTLEKFSLSDLM